MRVAVVGGTGDFGLALARRLAEAGDEVVIGSRDAERAQATARETGAAAGAVNEEAVAGAELVVLATKADAALATAASLAAAIGETPLLSVASALRFGPSGVLPAEEARSLAAGKLAQGRPAEDALVCGDDPEAKALALELAAKVVAGRALDAGPLAGARALEGLTAVIVNLNRRYRGHAGLRLTGLP